MAPVLALSDRPGGSPVGIDHRYGGVPPLAVSVVVGYATPTVPLGKELVEMVGGGGFWTVKVVLPLTVASVAETVVAPTATPVASPLGLTVATAALEEDQVAWLVMFSVLRLECVPVAVNCCDAPTGIAGGLAGVTAMDASVGPAGLNTTSTQ